MNKRYGGGKEEVFKVVWNIATELRGRIDGWEFKQYVFAILLYRFLSEKAETDLIQKGMEVSELQYPIPFFLFHRLLMSATGDIERYGLGDTLQYVFEAMKKEDQTGAIRSILFDKLDFCSQKLGSDPLERDKKLLSLMRCVADISTEEGGNDIFGDTYEYLLSMYSMSAGKSGGEYFTPHEVSELMARIVTAGKTTLRNIYDPACGSGSLLLGIRKLPGNIHVTDGYYGQDINETSSSLCILNMVLHNINHDNYHIVCGDTLTDPQLKGTYEAIVSNPPYSLHWGQDDPSIQNDPRFKDAGVIPPKSRADYAFILHCLHYLAEDGIAAIVCYPGVFYRTGKEKKIRKYLLRKNYIDCVIQLPPKLFTSTSSSVSILVLKKKRGTKKVLFIDGSGCSVRGRSRYILSADGTEAIMHAYRNWEEIPEFSATASYQEIADHDFDLSVPMYLRKEDPVLPMDYEEQLHNVLTQKNSLISAMKEGTDVFSLADWLRANIKDIPYIPLHNVLELHDGKQNYHDYGEGDIPVYSSGGILAYVDHAMCNTPSVIIPRKGSLGNLFYSEDPFSISDTVLYSVINDKLVRPKYVYHFLKAVGLESLGSKGGVPGLTMKKIYSIQIPVPDFIMQDQIVNKLDQYETLELLIDKELDLRKKMLDMVRKNLLICT